MVYSRRLVSGPAVEPVSKSEAKAQCRITHDEDDNDLEIQIIPAARTYTEDYCNRQFITAEWDVFLDQFPEDRGDIELPLGQLQEVEEIEITDASGAVTTWSISGENVLDEDGNTVAHIDSVKEPARIRLAYSGVWPPTILKTVNAIRIRIKSGYGDAAEDVPAPIKQAIKMAIEHFYNHRGAVVIGKSVAIDAKDMPRGFKALLDIKYRLHSFG